MVVVAEEIQELEQCRTVASPSTSQSRYDVYQIAAVGTFQVSFKTKYWRSWCSCCPEVDSRLEFLRRPEPETVPTKLVQLGLVIRQYNAFPSSFPPSSSALYILSHFPASPLIPILIYSSSNTILLYSSFVREQFSVLLQKHIKEHSIRLSIL